MIALPSLLVIQSFISTHRLVQNFVRKLTNEQLHWRGQSQHHSIAFHAWHVARWIDFFQASVPGMTPELSQRLPPGIQIWLAEGLAERWGFNPAELGFAQTGMHMPDERALELAFPSKDILLDYIERVFTKAQVAVDMIDEKQFAELEQQQPMTEGIWGEGTVGHAVMAHITHTNRHLGMMECLLGLQGQSGTATQ